MPTGVIINAASVLFGGIAGALVGHKLSPKFKAEISLIFGVCSMAVSYTHLDVYKRQSRHSQDSKTID